MAQVALWWHKFYLKKQLLIIFKHIFTFNNAKMPIMPNNSLPDKNATMTILLGIHIKYYYIYRIYIIKVFSKNLYREVNNKSKSY